MNQVTPVTQGQADAAAETLPHNIEAEQQLLGAILTNNDIYDRIAAIINEGHFYEPVHARIYAVASARITKNALASPVTLKAFLEEDEGLKELGGPAYLARLAGASISSFAARDYAQIDARDADAVLVGLAAEPLGDRLQAALRRAVDAASLVGLVPGDRADFHDMAG